MAADEVLNDEPEGPPTDFDETPPTSEHHPELKRLSPMVGVWAGKAAIRPTQFRKGSESPLKATFRWVLSGQHMEGDLTYAVGGSPYHALLLLSYDFHARQFVAYWADNFSSKPTIFRGAFTGDTLVLEGTSTEDGRTSLAELRINVGAAGWTLISSGDAMGDMTEGARLTASRPKN